MFLSFSSSDIVLRLSRIASIGTETTQVSNKTSLSLDLLLSAIHFVTPLHARIVCACNSNPRPLNLLTWETMLKKRYFSACQTFANLHLDCDHIHLILPALPPLAKVKRASSRAGSMTSIFRVVVIGAGEINFGE